MSDMSNRILVFYGSYRSDRMGIRLAVFVVDRLRRRGEDVELIDAKAVNLPMLDRPCCHSARAVKARGNRANTGGKPCQTGLREGGYRLHGRPARPSPRRDWSGASSC